MSDIDDAMDTLRWGAKQAQFSAELTPAQCRVLLANMELWLELPKGDEPESIDPDDAIVWGEEGSLMGGER